MQSTQMKAKGWYLEEGQKRIPEFVQDVVDLRVQLIGLEQGPPSLENRVCDLKHANVDGRVVGRHFRHEIL